MRVSFWEAVALPSLKKGLAGRRVTALLLVIVSSSERLMETCLLTCSDNLVPRREVAPWVMGHQGGHRGTWESSWRIAYAYPESYAELFAPLFIR